MQGDRERIEWVRPQINSSGCDAFLCCINAHVVMLTGYAPVLGQSFVLFPEHGEPCLIVPESELSLARQGFVKNILTYPDAGFGNFQPFFYLAGPVIATAAAELGVADGRIGYEGSTPMETASYTQVSFPSHGTIEAYRISLPAATLIDVSPVLSLMMARMTGAEQSRLRVANRIARLGYLAARHAIQSSARECDVAAQVIAAIEALGREHGAERVAAYCHVMSGSRASEAYLPFNLTNARQICAGDPVIVQLEVCADGYWAEVTRTFFAGDPGPEGRRFYESCLAAQQKALAMIRDGVAAEDVDQAARDYLAVDGFGQFFKHGTGHGVGFQAISHLEPPRLEPGSTDTLLTDMVCNVEPAIYIHGWGGVRINDTVVVTENGYQLLTEDIPRDLAWAICEAPAKESAA
ncbi:MAG TPA: Xaa-Pro peptidase family protein [Chloroflexota bacterium]|nr:Xaa-Pro peptidase family protein [Chloroflexota bacterium]